MKSRSYPLMELSCPFAIFISAKNSDIAQSVKTINTTHAKYFAHKAMFNIRTCFGDKKSSCSFI